MAFDVKLIPFGISVEEFFKGLQGDMKRKRKVGETLVLDTARGSAGTSVYGVFTTDSDAINNAISLRFVRRSCSFAWHTTF